MRQRHWEGLIQGKKSLHRGQLLPGSSTSDEDLNNVTATSGIAHDELAHETHLNCQM